MKIGNKNAPHGVAWLTSSGLANDRLVCEFLKLVLGRKGVDLNAEDAKLDSGGLRAKYAAEIATIKVLHMNDGNYHKPSETCRAGRANRVYVAAASSPLRGGRERISRMLHHPSW